MSRDDRRVHAEDPIHEVVRYERAGAWYLENRSGTGGRERLTVGEAAGYAKAMERAGGRVHRGLPGGSAFDRLVKP